MHKIKEALRSLFSNFLACDGEDEQAGQGGGGETAAPATPPGGGTAEGEAAQSDAQALTEAARLEAANQRIEELQGKLDNQNQQVEERAHELLFEVMPEAFEQPSAPMPPQTRLPAQTVTPQPGQTFQPGDEFSAEADGAEGAPPAPDPGAQLGRVLSEQEQRITEMEDQQYAAALNHRLDLYQQKYPEMDRFRVTTYLANHGEMADRINIEKLCEISHNKELARMNSHAERYHAEQLAKIQEGGQPPPVPGAPLGTPNDGVKITRANASQVLAERLQARGFGRT
jgi:hypothetical protein